MDLEKFITMCEGHGGKYNKHKELEDVHECDVYECEFEDFEDYNAFITWLKKHEVKNPNITYRAKWNFAESKSNFELNRNGKLIDFYTEESIVSRDILFRDISEEKALDVSMIDVMKKAKEKARKKINEMKPHIRDLVDIDIGIGYNPNYGYYYAYSHAIYRSPYPIHSVFLNDMVEATLQLVDELKDAFYTEFQARMRFALEDRGYTLIKKKKNEG